MSADALQTHIGSGIAQAPRWHVQLALSPTPKAHHHDIRNALDAQGIVRSLSRR